jgi:Txe/YoeB family toxin of Txe-Axe toxin-antitoxin module
MAVPSTRALRNYFLIVLLALLAGCSSLRLVYNHGDTLLYWWIDAYVDFDAEQKTRVRHDIDNLFQWHRKTQLRDYVQILQTGQRQLQGAPTTADLLGDYEEIKSRTQLLLFKALPELADLARSLRPEQIARLDKKFSANNDEFRKKNMKGDRERQMKFRYQKSMEQFELWFGSFSSEQEAVIRKASDARPLDNDLWLDERMRRQKNILALVQKVQRDKLNKEATMAQLHGLIKDSFERLDHSERKAFFDAYNEATAQLILTVIKIATPAQKAHAQKRMQGWIDDFNQLAQEPR